MELKYYYSATTGGLYVNAAHGAEMPLDAREITEQTYYGLIGRDVVADHDGNPILRPARTFSDDERRAALVAAVTAKRWESETGGITLPNGTRVLTGKSDQNRITSVIVNAEIAGIQSVDFKSDSGWVTLSIGEIKGIAAAIGAHVQACFTAERMHHEAIAALDAAGIETYDINTGWPVAAPNPQEH